MTYNNNLCLECNIPLEQKPAGVSRTTGKPYKAFSACPNYKNHSPKIPQAMPQPQNSPVLNQSKLTTEMVILEELESINKRLNNMAQFLVDKLGSDKKEELPPLSEIKF